MTSPAPQLYTAASIAAALGLTARAVKARLQGVSVDGTSCVRGQSANAWRLDSVPQPLRRELAEMARRRCCKDVEALLADPPARWIPPVPWHNVPATFQERAVKLAEALGQCAAHQHELSGPDLMELARVRYRQHFGNDLADDKLRYILDRATKRAGGFYEWQRPELWLDDAAFQSATGPTAPEPPVTAPGVETHHDVLKDHLPADLMSPTTKDRAYLLHFAFVHFEQLAGTDAARQRTVKASLIEYLHRQVPGLYNPHAGTCAEADSKALLALRQLFNRGHAEWIAGGRKVEALLDRRRGKVGRKGYRCDDCEKKIRRTAAEHRGDHGTEGNVELAIGRLLFKKQLCPICSCVLARGCPSESFRIRVTPNALQVAFLKGPDKVRAIAPTHHCDWSESRAGDVFVIDDMTTNELAWDYEGGEFVCGQAQLLFTEDEFSQMPLPFILYFGAPSALAIKRAITLVLTRVGLPHRDLLTERGVFNNRMLGGTRRAAEAILFRELEAELNGLLQFGQVEEGRLARLRNEDLGLRDPAFGLKIRHATSPQVKTVERTFYEFQKSASVLPGFGGFRQRDEMPRAMADFNRRVEIGKEHPGNEYRHLADLRKDYEAIFAEIRERRVNGKRHQGRSPLEVWKGDILEKPLRKLPVEMEHLLASHRIPRKKIQTQGLSVKLNRYDTAFYFNEHTGALCGRHVAVRINYDLPDFVHIEHPDTGQLLKVDMVQTRRHTATSEDIATASRARRAHMNAAIGEIGNIESPVTSWIERPGLYTGRDMVDGRALMDAAQEHKTEKEKTKRQLAHLRRKAGALGATMPEKPKHLNRQVEADDLEREALAEMEREGKNPEQP